MLNKLVNVAVKYFVSKMDTLVEGADRGQIIYGPKCKGFIP